VNRYDAAREAEAAGANITTLTRVLNEAGLLFSQAEFAFSVGDFFGCAGIMRFRRSKQTRGFCSDAEALKIAGEGQRNQDFLINVVGSTVGNGCCSGWELWIVVFPEEEIPKRWRARELDLLQYKTLFLVVTGVLALLVASPVLQKVLVYPQTEFFTELCSSARQHTAENYPTTSRQRKLQCHLGSSEPFGIVRILRC